MKISKHEHSLAEAEIFGKARKLGGKSVHKMTKLLKYSSVVVALVLFMSSCATTETTTSSRITSFPVEIISEPLGAKVEVNDNYIGMTPITINLEGWESTRTFIRRHTIIAHPVRAGGQIQIKMFRGWYEPDHKYGDPIPSKIYFNMNLVRIPEQYDININKNK